MSRSRFLPRQAMLIIALQLTNSMCVSSLVPMMGYFIVDGLGADPWQIGLYTGLVAPLTLLTNRWAGERLDRGVLVRPQLLIAVIAFLAVAGLLTQTTELWLLLALVAPLMSLSNMGSGIVFTYGRLYADQAGLDIGRMNSWLRMSVSLAWMIGPAAAFSIAAQFGFQAAFISAFGLGLLYLVLWHVVMPRGFRAPPKDTSSADKDPINWGLITAGLICLTFVITNSLFVSVMPLYFIDQVGLPGFTPGLSLSVKCLLEVIIILASVRLAERFGVRTILLFSAGLAVIDMLLFTQVNEVWQVAAVAVLEGIHYGLFAGVAITFVQSFAPDRPGRATAVYMNSLFLGGMIGSVSMGFIASAVDYRAVLYVASAVSLAGMAVLLATARLRPAPETRPV
ncbi:MAG: MFS transporter [Labrenzia sp.]